MCGIAGFTFPRGLPGTARERCYSDRLRRMTASLYHRGPDEDGYFFRPGIGMASRRLSSSSMRARTFTSSRMPNRSRLSAGR